MRNPHPDLACRGECGQFGHGVHDSSTDPDAVRALFRAARGEHLLTVIDAHEHSRLAGPAAAEAARRLEEFEQRTRFQGTVVLDDRRLRRIMNRDDPAVHPGTDVTCVHDPGQGPL